MTRDRSPDFAKRYRVPAKGFRLSKVDPADTAGLERDASRKLRDADLERLSALQKRLYAEGRRALLVVFQAMDAAGKDGTIAHVMAGVNAQGVRVTSFKQPTATELAHDWLWRCVAPLPERGQIGIFNRSHYEEVIVVRVHPEYLAGEGVDPAAAKHKRFWERRFETIAAWERHLAESGTEVVKFFLHVSREEQRKRLLARADDPEKRWKFSPQDVAERARWDDYQAAYEAALRATSTDAAPWYAIPADHKWLIRTAVARILVGHLEAMDPRFPEPSPAERRAAAKARRGLAAEGDS